MIISASYKTDIPAFYGEWFVNRLGAGFCKMTNPYNGQTVHIDLSLAAVDGFVFWTRNIRPFLPALDEVRGRGWPFVVQYTITGYPRDIETCVVRPDAAIEHMHRLAAKFGRRVAVWRYDPILFSSLTPAQFHEENFARLGSLLQGATDEAVISFAQVYRKTQRNMDRAASQHEFSWHDPDDSAKRNLLTRLAAIAAGNGLKLSLCSQRQFLCDGVLDARCIDIRRLSDAAGRPIIAREKPHRAECGCFQSRDIGDYDTCPHGCVYCYAVRNRDLARQRYHGHDPSSEFLRPPAGRDSASAQV